MFFFDIESLKSGKFNRELLKVIDECHSVLVILNPNSLDRCMNENDWVKIEIAHAIKQQKNIIPVFTNGFTWPDVLPECINELRYYNGAFINYDFFDGFMNKLYGLIQSNTPFSTLHSNQNHLAIWGDFQSNIISKLVKK